MSIVTAFCYDNVQIGKIAKDLHKRVAFCSSCYVDTIAPSSVFGTFPNLWSQRVRVWDTGRHSFVVGFLASLLIQREKSA
jgi:hypothetical protein